MMALEKVRERLDGQLARDMHESMRIPIEAGKVLYRKPCITCKGVKRSTALVQLQHDLDATHDPAFRASLTGEIRAIEKLGPPDAPCGHCKGTGFEPFEEFDQLPPVVREGRIMAAKWLFDRYILQRRIPKA